MPIRMEQDPEQEQRRDDIPRQRDTGGAGGGGGLGKLLPFLLLFIFKKPKLLIPLLLIGAVWYFFLGGSEMLSGGGEGQYDSSASEFSFGAALDEQRYDKAEVFAALSSTYGSSENQMPAAISLLQYAPKRLHQGRQGSCVGWASSYAARTILQSRMTGQAPDNVAFSPSFLYNQIALEGCQGAYMPDAMETLRRYGDLPFSKFQYDERSCSRTPSDAHMTEAEQFRIKGYNRLSQGAEQYGVDIDGVRQHIAQGAPVVIGMLVGGTFMHEMMGRGAWRPTQRDYSGYGFSGHAMCAIGYDDNKQAFQIMNSWGPEWGDNGTAWVSYRDFQHFVKEAYGLYPMGSAAKFDPNKLAVKFGLVDNETQTLLPLRQAGDRIFRTSLPLHKGKANGTRFKIAITNSIECYVYVFGEETNGSSYVLFPYTQKHSPYCGITGTRVFPNDHSMYPDDVGNKDYFAVVVSKAPLDWNALNSSINTSRQGSYAARVREAIGQQEVPNVQFAASDAVEFSCQLNGKNVVATIIEVDKR